MSGAPRPGTVFNQAAQNVRKTLTQSIPQAVQQGVKNEAVRTFEDVGEQFGVDLPGLPEPEEQFDVEAYRQQIKQEEEAKLAQLRAKLSQMLSSEMQRAGQQRGQKEQAWVQNVEAQMQATPDAQAEALLEAQKVQGFVPQAVQAKRGIGEAKRQHKG